MTLGDVTRCGTYIASCYVIVTRVGTNFSPGNNFDMSLGIDSQTQSCK